MSSAQLCPLDSGWLGRKCWGLNYLRETEYTHRSGRATDKNSGALTGESQGSAVTRALLVLLTHVDNGGSDYLLWTQGFSNSEVIGPPGLMRARAGFVRRSMCGPRWH